MENNHPELLSLIEESLSQTFPAARVYSDEQVGGLGTPYGPAIHICFLPSGALREGKKIARATLRGAGSRISYVVFAHSVGAAVRHFPHLAAKASATLDQSSYGSWRESSPKPGPSGALSEAHLRVQDSGAAVRSWTSEPPGEFWEQFIAESNVAKFGGESDDILRAA